MARYKETCKTFPYIILCKTCDSQVGVKFDPRAIFWRTLIETHYVKLHAKFGSSEPYGFWQKDFQIFQKILSIVAMATRVF